MISKFIVVGWTLFIGYAFLSGLARVDTLLATPAHAAAPEGIRPDCWKAANGLHLQMANVAAERNLEFKMPKSWDAMVPRLVAMAERLEKNNLCELSFDELRSMVIVGIKGQAS